MANRRKGARRRQRTHSIMWWAFVFSGIFHLFLVYLLPTIDFLPSDPGYIEIDETWLAPLPDEDAVDDLSEEPIAEGTEPVSAPSEASSAWNVPPRVDAIEPVRVAERYTENVWETAFVGQTPTLSETLEQSERERGILVPPDKIDIPPLTLKEFAAQTHSKQMPSSDVIENPVSEPEIQTKTEVELHAEQRFQDTLFPDASPQAPETLDPERLPVRLPESLDVKREALPPVVTSVPRPASVPPERLLAVASTRSSPIHAKSLPSLVVPEIPERQALEDEDTIAATEIVMNFPGVPAETLRIDPADELPEPEAQRPEAFEAQPILLPDRPRPDRTIEAAPRLQYQAETAVPGSLDTGRQTPAIVSDKIRVASLSGSNRTQELMVNDSEMQALKPIFTRGMPEITEAPEPPADVLRPITPKALTAPGQDEQIPVRRTPALSGTQRRSLLLGVKEHVPTLPLNAPRFGIVARKDASSPEEAVPPDTELRPDETLQQAEQEPEQASDEFVIEGPAATRQVQFKPRQFPDVELDMDVTIRLKFWVLPDGTVGEVLPLQRGDVRLERAAIGYMKNWRFTPVSPEQPQVWGIIPITYTLR